MERLDEMDLWDALAGDVDVSQINGKPASSPASDPRLTALFRGNLPEERILRFHWADIEAALITQNYCPACKGLHRCQQTTPGWEVAFEHREYQATGNVVFRYGHCRYFNVQEIEQERKKSLRKRYAHAGFHNFKVNKENRPALALCRNWVQQYTDLTEKGIALAGPPGTGKTHLVTAIYNELLSKGVPAYFVVVPELLQELRRAIDEPERGTPKVDRARDRRVVILDDLGAERPTDWVAEQLYLLINERYRAKLPTIITTNCIPEELEDRLGAPTVDRLWEMCEWVFLGGESWRRKSKEE